MSDMSEAQPNASPPPLRILFHIDDFGRGGTETALIGWLNALDRRLFAPSLAVTFPTSDFDHWRAQGFPADVPVHILASSPWMHRLHQTQRERKLRFGEKLLYKLSTHAAIRPIVARRFLKLAQAADAVDLVGVVPEGAANGLGHLGVWPPRTHGRCYLLMRHIHG